MKKAFFLSMIILGLPLFSLVTPVAAHAMRSPLQTSVSQIRAVTKVMEADLRLQFITVSKIIIEQNIAKAEYMDSTGFCTSLSYRLYADPLGNPQAQEIPDASTACEPKFARINPITGETIHTR